MEMDVAKKLIRLEQENQHLKFKIQMCDKGLLELKQLVQDCRVASN